jgi:hypothetical protein
LRKDAIKITLFIIISGNTFNDCHIPKIIYTINFFYHNLFLNHFSILIHFFIPVNMTGEYFLGIIAHNVPAVCDVLPARIRACVARPESAKCGGATAWEWSVAQ